MATGDDERIGGGLRAALELGAARELGDGQLLERFAIGGPGEGAELAFAALVGRHGPMVLRVARGILADPHEAQDAFQATFLVLVARARGLQARDSLGPWLHQVARRVALCQRSAAARRRRLDRRAAVDVAAPRADPGPADDLARVVHEEVDRLPERYRAPLVLCDLEGQTHEQAARALGWPVGTVKSRQSRGRDRLRDRLARRGVAPGLALSALRSPFGLAPPPPLIQSTTAAAIRSFAPRAFVPGPAAALAREVISAMKLVRSFQAASIVVVALGTASGVGLVAQEPAKQAIKPPPLVAQPRVRPPIDPPVVEVKPAKLTCTLSERGVVEPARRVDLMCDVEGGTTIIRILPEGTRVKAGDVVFELESATLRDSLTNQKVATQQADARYKQALQAREIAEFAVREYVDGVAPQQLAELDGKIAAARANIDQGQARRERAQLARKRLDAIATRQAGPEGAADVLADLTVADRLAAVEVDLRSFALDLEAATTQRATFTKFTRDKATRQLRRDVEQARAEELSKQASWDLERIQEAKLERQIKACTVVAPADGLLVYANDPGRAAGGRPAAQVEEGATVRERQRIASVVDLDQLRINAKVREAWVDKVLPGQTVRIKVEAIPDRILTGVVQAVAPRADRAALNANGSKVYETLIQVNEGVPDLRPGMGAAVDILLFDLDDVLTIPVSAVVHIDDQDQVAVRTPTGAVEWRAVTLGRSNDEAVEVKQGLRPGDRVLLDRRRR